MGNRNVVFDKDDKVIGEYNTSLACFSLVCDLVKKYNPTGSIFDPHKINETLEPVYEQCEGFEEVQLLMFINDESKFTEADIPKFEEAIERYSFGNDGPKTHLVFMRDVLKKYGAVRTKYMDTTMAMAVTSAGRFHDTINQRKQ